MSKRLPVNEPCRPPVRLRLPQIGLQELKTIRVAIKRKDLPPGSTGTGPLIRNLDDPDDLILHKPGEGERPIFDRDDIIVNLDFEERVVVATSDTSKSSVSRSEEKQTNNSRSRRSRSHSRHRSLNKEYYSRSRSRSNDRMERTSTNQSKEDTRTKSTTSFHRSGEERGTRVEKSTNYDKPEATSTSKDRRRSGSKERQRSTSREREHSKYYRSPSRTDTYRAPHYEADRRSRRTPSPHKYDYRHRKHSRSPPYKRDRDRPRYSKSQERRSRSPLRERDPKYREYRKRSRSPHFRERYNKSPARKIHREYSRSPPKYRGPPDEPRRPIPPYQMPPHFGPPWPVYEPIPPYVRFVIPDGYIPAPPLRFPGGVSARPRMPLRQLPVYNSRPVPKISDSMSPVANPNIATSSSITSLSTITNTNVTSDIISGTVSRASDVEHEDIAKTSTESVDNSAVTTQGIVKTTDS